MIVAMLSWFDERGELLQETIAELAAVGVKRLVAVDGAYELHPSEHATSHVDQVREIAGDCEFHGIELILHRPVQKWANSEVGKRQAMMELALAVTTSADWLLVVDSDHHWRSEIDLERALAGVHEDFAKVSFAETFNVDKSPIWSEALLLMRAKPGLHMGTNHYTYITADDTFATVLNRPTSTAPALDLRGKVFVVHGVYERPEAERERQALYYGRRDRLGIEK